MEYKRESYVDRRKNRFDRRKRGLWHKVYYSPIALLFTILQRQRSGQERRKPGEHRAEWIRISPWVSQYFPGPRAVLKPNLIPPIPEDIHKIVNALNEAWRETGYEWE